MNKNLSFSVSAQRIELTDAAMLVAGTVNEYTARFTFDADWDGYRRTAVFSCGDISREQLLTDDACTVPWEVLVANGYLRVGVYGTKDGSRLPTIWTERRLYINPGAGPTQEAEDPSPTLVEQLLARMGDLAALKTEDKSSLVAAINEVWSSGGSGGASVTDAAINEDGHLIITLSTGTTIDAGYAVGPAGPAGQDGAPGKDGAAGAPGKDGVGIQSVDQTTTSTDDGGTNIITVTKSDGSSSTFQVRNGSKGSTGPAGADGAPGKDGLGVPAPTAEDAGKVPVVQEDGTYGLADRIAPPATAQVGQTIVVKTVDADGKPTAWEAVDLPTGGSTARRIFPVNFKAVETNRSTHDCTFIGDEIVSFTKPSDGGYARYINPQTWVRTLQRKINFTEAATNKELEMKSTDYKFGKLLVGNGRTIKSDESSYADQGARLYVFYDAASWRDDPAAEITFDNCGTYDVIDISGLGYKVYGFWGGAADTVFVSCNLFNDVYLIQLGAGTNNLGTGTYSAAEDSRYNGSYKVIGHWTNTHNYGEFAAHGGQYYNGSLYLATNDTSKCTVYRCDLKDDGTMDFDALNFEAYIPSAPNTLMYRYIDGMCIKDGTLYAQPLNVGTVNSSNGTTMLIANLTDFGDKFPDGGSAGQVLTKQTDGSVAWNTPSGGSGGGMEIIASGELSEDATLLEISTDNDGNAFELTEAVLFVGGAVSEANTTNGHMTLRTNINSAAKGGTGTTITGFFRNSNPKKYQIHLVCAGVITGLSFYDGNSKGYVNNNFDTITKIFLFGTDDNGKTFGAGTTYLLKGVKK